MRTQDPRRVVLKARSVLANAASALRHLSSRAADSDITSALLTALALDDDDNVSYTKPNPRLVSLRVVT